ncbi:MAG: hypothetical protein ITD31_05825 [Nitrosospira sp.]|nr:hypothetical protein [Nitrosospira sp.]
MKKTILILIICFIPSVVFAQKVDVKGLGTITYEGSVFSNEPSDSDKKNAIEAARMSAWRNYVATFNSAKQRTLMINEAVITANIDKFITDLQIIDQKIIPSLNTYTVLVRVGFNPGLIDQFIESQSVGNGLPGSQRSATRSTDSLFALLFMARKEISVKQFETRKTKIKEATSTTSSDDEGGVSARTSNTEGGNSLRKADDIKYAVSSSQDIDAAVGEVLNTANVEYAGYDDIVSNCGGISTAEFKAEFVDDDELSPQTRAKVIGAARVCGVRYFAYGTIDTGLNDTDPVSGNKRVYVSVRAQMWDISHKLPRKIGSVGPIQYSGLGPDQTVAGRNALRIAAKEAARDLVDQLNAKSIR